MRDCRTKGETPLHRAAAFGDEEALQMLLDAGARVDAVDMNGDSPLCWGSRYARPAPVLRCFVMAPIVSVRGIARWGGICRAILIGRAS